MTGSAACPHAASTSNGKWRDDEWFGRVAQRGMVTAAPESAHSVHVELTGLRPGADYFYRFRAGGHVSPSGRTRTAPDGGSLAPMTMCVASCSNYEQGWFTAYRRLADEDPDLVVHLGDYHYECAASGKGVRAHVGPETVTLANYRQRYAQYKTDPDLQAAHAAAPWLAVYDDHEVADNWADEVPEKPDPAFLGRRAAALRAYYENMPLRRSAAPRGIDMQLYRRVQWGGLATMHMLDTRQYRTDQPCADAPRTDCDERLRPSATLTGTEQERWLLNGFQQSRFAMGHPGAAGVLLAGRFDTGAGSRIQPRRVGRLRGQPRPRRRWHRALTRAQRRGTHRRHPFALGGRGTRAMRRFGVASGGHRTGDDIDQFGWRRVRYL